MFRVLSNFTAAGRRRTYRRGRPVLIRVKVGAPYEWATHLLCHGSQLWAIADLGRPSERRLELHADEGPLELGCRRIFRSVFLISANGHQVRIATRDRALLRRAVRRWHRRLYWWG